MYGRIEYMATKGNNAVAAPATFQPRNLLTAGALQAPLGAASKPAYQSVRYVVDWVKLRIAELVVRQMQNSVNTSKPF